MNEIARSFISTSINTNDDKAALEGCNWIGMMRHIENGGLKVDYSSKNILVSRPVFYFFPLTFIKRTFINALF